MSEAANDDDDDDDQLAHFSSFFDVSKSFEILIRLSLIPYKV